MSTINDGGPAFPVPEAVGQGGGFCAADSKGMTLRDWFAGQVLAGVCANPHGCIVEPPDEPSWSAETPENRGGGGSPGNFNWSIYGEEAARLAFATADAMLAERAKEKKP